MNVIKLFKHITVTKYIKIYYIKIVVFALTANVSNKAIL